MIFKQLFDEESYTYTYLLASRHGGEALLIDPVNRKFSHYIKLLGELNVKLVKAIDTHCHADHITALGSLRDATNCVTVMGEKSCVDLVSIRVEEGDEVEIENIKLKVLYTPGHTDDSYCYLFGNSVFTGDTLLIRGTGRTDFQNGDPIAAYDSLFNKVLKLDEEVIVWPGHDYKGNTSSTIAEEKAHNPRLQVSSPEEYAVIMNNLNLPNPKMMDQAVPANLKIGYSQNDPALIKNSISVDEAKKLVNTQKILCIDIRESFERKKFGIIPGSIYVPYTALTDKKNARTQLEEATRNHNSSVLIYCAYGERSALALKLLKSSGMQNVYHLSGGMNAWRKSDKEINII